MNKEERLRQLAIQRYLKGESPKTIYESLNRSKAWFFKWLDRFNTGIENWYENQPRTPETNPNRTPDEIVETVKMVRLELYNQDLFHGPQAIRWRLEDLGVHPLPSERTIGRILSRYGLTHKRTGRYEPKGKLFPKLEGKQPGAVHQTDFVGPCYLKGGVRFYSLNSVDIHTSRCGVEPVTKGKQNIVSALWNTWLRLGIPFYQQVDNEMVFYGSPAYPRGMGKLIRLCLRYGVEPYFIPIHEPWHNGVVEKFNHQWRDKFFHRIQMKTVTDIHMESLSFEQRHNRQYRYSKLRGKTPNECLEASKKHLRYPESVEPPETPLPKPETGKYHVVRFIRSDGILNIFSEKFSMPPEATYEYVKATIDVEKQRLLITLDKEIIDEKEYRLR